MPKGIRAKENRTITVSIPISLVADIDAFAKADDRGRSKWIVREMHKAIERRKSHGIHALPMAAEEEGEYKTKRTIKPRDTVR